MKQSKNRDVRVRERNSNLELLRIIATLFVIMLHYNNKNNGKAFAYTEALETQYQVLVCMEMLAICAVNIFVMISGFFMCRSQKADVTKVLRLYADVIFCSVIRYVMNCTIGSQKFAVPTLLYFMIPLCWYVAVYSALYLISPYLNRMIRGLSEAQFRNLLIIFMIVFSVWPSALELITALTGMKLTSMSPLGTQGSGAGYTIIHFIVMYCMGAYLNLHGNENVDGKSTWKALGGYIICTVLLVLYSKVYFSGALSYCNPLVIIQSVAIFRVFQSVEFKSRIVNTIAGCSFGVYLLHTYFFKYFRIEKYATGNALLIPLHMIMTAVMIYGISALIFWIYQKTAGALIGRCLKKLSFMKYEVT